MTRPQGRPQRPLFSSGPCAKRPGWTPNSLNDAALGRSHRSKPGKAKLQNAGERAAMAGDAGSITIRHSVGESEIVMLQNGTIRIKGKAISLDAGTGDISLKAANVSVKVTDNGSPAMSASQTFTVTVLDFLELTLGSTNVQAGQSAREAVRRHANPPATRSRAEFPRISPPIFSVRWRARSRPTR